MADCGSPAFAAGGFGTADMDIMGAQSKILTTDAVEASDVVITVGCGDACPITGKRYEN
ncbi:hypothetical protein [Nonomuraea endophytica]|uniref:hypothetical protein n=1 Tax=Nonomuraea endophytica TaxID=714136 RepID=UPI0037C9A948